MLQFESAEIRREVAALDPVDLSPDPAPGIGAALGRQAGTRGDLGGNGAVDASEVVTKCGVVQRLAAVDLVRKGCHVRQPPCSSCLWRRLGRGADREEICRISRTGEAKSPHSRSRRLQLTQ